MANKIKGTKGKVFTIKSEIGRGGFGVVYLVSDQLENLFAMKIIEPITNPGARLSFKQEIESTIDLTHPNILPIMDYGTFKRGKDEIQFVVSQYCPNGDYRRRMFQFSSNKPTLEVVLQDFKQILEGLNVLHSKIVHRDLKPENVFVVDGALKVGDFGLSKFVDEATRTLTFKGSGTPRYMAPEVWEVLHATPATDLYAIGIMLFEALTGKAPFEASDAKALRELHLYTPAPRVRLINPSVPDTLDGVIKKLLEKDARKRFQSATEVLQALNSLNIKPKDSKVSELASRMRSLHDQMEKQQTEQEREAERKRKEVSKNQYKETELLGILEEAVTEVNEQLHEIRIEKSSRYGEVEYHIAGRSLVIHFFSAGEIFNNPEVPGLMDVLRRQHVVHGGYIEVKEGGQMREGWNFVLIRPPESPYGEWHIVETRLSPLSGRVAKHEPFATEARAFATNYGYHLHNTMHVFVLKDKVLDKSDILHILDVLIPKI